MDNEVRFIELPKIKDLRGNLSFLEDNHQIPFKIERVYWIYDVPGGEERGGHAFKNTTEFILPLSGGITVETIRGEAKHTFKLDTTHKGILIPPYTWRKIGGFLSNSICLVVADTKFEESEYLRDFNEYSSDFKKIFSL
ncbi:sugar 3,4-ketoisomerase [Plebeiibacterium sediminum]|uniref:FdtA/QdtA family cupin domain-containing protein n=1 Tax=Plebeiibacterium sediminum TaxID=2992112 RepID=A0AAE3M1E0_9BACT|nr:FdtA/QdtA family cupin domain-containing protein [Plebeiobacterium sediminum]MCW3785516.1 FdtA/QdtA family cupin domain-containing protein [Plebeiobacterium sediminum]